MISRADTNKRPGIFSEKLKTNNGLADYPLAMISLPIRLWSILHLHLKSMTTHAH